MSLSKVQVAQGDYAAVVESPWTFADEAKAQAYAALLSELNPSRKYFVGKLVVPESE